MAKSTSGAPKGKKSGSIFSVLGSYSGRVVVLVVMALAGSASNMVIPKIIAHGIDSFSQNHFNFGSVILQFLLASSAIFLFTFLQNLFQTYTSEKVALDLRSSISEKISRQSYSFVLKSNPSKLLTNLTSDVDSVKMFVSHRQCLVYPQISNTPGLAHRFFWPTHWWFYKNFRGKELQFEDDITERQ